MLYNVITCAAEPAAAYISSAFLGVRVFRCPDVGVRVLTTQKATVNPLRRCPSFTYNHFYTHMPAQLVSKWLLHHREL